MASLFVADAMGEPLAGGLRAHRPDLLDGVGLIVGIDRFMSEARAVTNFSGNAVATLLVGTWTKTVDRTKVDGVLSGGDPFNELTMVDDRDDEPVREPAAGAAPAATYTPARSGCSGPGRDVDAAGPSRRWLEHAYVCEQFRVTEID